MKSKKLVSAILILALTGSCALAGCNKKTGEKPGGGAEVALDKDQTLNFRISADPRTMDVSLNFESLGGYLIIATNEPLTRKTQDDKGNVKTVPGGAESWKNSDDGLTWTFKIREMNWSDGKPVTAKDYEYSMKRTINPKTGAAYAGLFNMVKNATAATQGKATLDEVGIKALDDRTLEFKLSNPCAYFLNLTSFYTFAAQRQDLVEKYGDKYGSEPQTVLSCGPFVMKEWVHNSKISLVKNDKYWDAKNVKLQTLNLPVIQEENAALTQLNNGEIDYSAATIPEWITKLKKNDKLKEKTQATPTIGFIALNQNAVINGVKLFSNKKIRQAISLAFNREEYVNVVNDGLGIPCYAFVPPGIHIGDKEFRSTVNNEPLKKVKEQNPDVKKLVADGLKELGADTDPSKYEITYLFGSTAAKAKQNGEYYQQVIQKATGFKLKLEFVEAKVRTQRFRNGDYNMTASAWSADYDDPNTYLDLWVSTNKTYPTGWKNARYDELIDKAGKERDNTKRTEYFKEAEQILIEEAVIIATYYNVSTKFINVGVKGLTDIEMGGGTDFKNVYIQGRKK